MSVDTFVPEIWSAALLEPLQRAHVYADVVNHDYEGNIANLGDTVHINMMGDVTISDYSPNVTEIDPEPLNTTDLTIVIDTCKYFAIEIDDVDRVQALPGLMPAGMARASHNLRNLVDLKIASYYTSAYSSNTITTTAITTPALAVQGLTDLMVKLDEADVPRDGTRWAVVTPWYHGLLTSSPDFIAATPEEALLNGRVGRCKDFDVRLSNNSPNPTGDDSIIMAGTNQAISYAEQIPIGSVEAYRSQKRFADVVRGMHLYGAKLLRPEFLAVLVASKT
jgi:hypothetical protein